MTPDFTYDVFLSHSSQDKLAVRALAERLREDRIRVWFDEWKIGPGDSIPAKIEAGLEQSRVLVLCMSDSAFGSDWAQLEAGTFRFRDPLNSDRRFIPLRLDDAPIRGSLAQFLYIDWRIEDHEQAYLGLLKACRETEPGSATDMQDEKWWSRAKPQDVAAHGPSRDDFPKKTKDTLSRRVGMRCSNPDCRQTTSGPQSDPDKAINIGVAAHITAASSGGPRYDGSLSKVERSSIQNGLWLCQNCAKLVDSDVGRFTVELLQEWKKNGERSAQRALETSASIASDIGDAATDRKTSAAKRKIDKAQELARSGKLSEAIAEALESLEIARNENDEEQEVETLLALALLSSDRQGIGDRLHYFQEAEKKVDKIKAPAAKAIYLRAKAAVLGEQGDTSGAEALYKEALDICSREEDDEKRNLATQACILRSDYVHLLCGEKRYEEAEAVLRACEDYARDNRDARNTELLGAALEAGIHLYLDTKDKEGAVARIEELEAAATTIRLADRIGGELLNIANHAAHRKMYGAALRAAEASIRLGHRCDDGKSPGFLIGALYTEAMILAKSGDEMALTKAQAVLSACCRPEDQAVRQAASQLIAEIRRTAGDSESAVDLARGALALATGGPENIAFSKSALARALNDNGQTEEAFNEASEAWALLEQASIPPKTALDVLAQVTNYGSQIGNDAGVRSALDTIAVLPDEEGELEEEKTRVVARADANRQIRERILEISTPSSSEDGPNIEAGVATLQDANARVVEQLIGLWDEVPEAAGGIYDFWGRGNFVRLLENARRYPTSFNVTVEVRSLEDVKRAIRLWGLYADFLLLLWKGESQSGLAIVPFPRDFKGPGGWGYIVAMGDEMKVEGSSKIWHGALAQISSIPDDVAAFLATEARRFVETGRLIVVSAPAVGCTNPGHGPFEQLLAESANAIPSVRWKGFEGEPIGLVPYSPNAPLELLAELTEIEDDRLRKLRLLLVERSRQLVPGNEVKAGARILALEIDDALRDLTDRTDAFSRRKGLERAAEPLCAGIARFRREGLALSDEASHSPFAPLFVLQSLGYGWRVDSGAIPKPPGRFQPESGDIVGTWLAPPTAGWTVPIMRAVDADDRET